MVFYHIYNVFGKDQNQKSDDKEPIQIKKKISTNQHDVHWSRCSSDDANI